MLKQQPQIISGIGSYKHGSECKAEGKCCTNHGIAWQSVHVDILARLRKLNSMARVFFEPLVPRRHRSIDIDANKARVPRLTRIVSEAIRQRIAKIAISTPSGSPNILHRYAHNQNIKCWQGSQHHCHLQREPTRHSLCHFWLEIMSGIYL